MKEEKKPEYPEKTPDDEIQKNPTYQSPEIQAPTETRIPTLALEAGQDSRRVNHYITRLSQCGSTSNWVSRSVPGIHVTRCLDVQQPTNKQNALFSHRLYTPAHSPDRLVGLVVKSPASRVEDPVFESPASGFFRVETYQ